MSVNRERQDLRQELDRTKVRIWEIEERLRPLTPHERHNLRAELRRLRSRRKRLLTEIQENEQPSLLEDT